MFEDPNIVACEENFSGTGVWVSWVVHPTTKIVTRISKFLINTFRISCVSENDRIEKSIKFLQSSNFLECPL